MVLRLQGKYVSWHDPRYEGLGMKLVAFEVFYSLIPSYIGRFGGGGLG